MTPLRTLTVAPRWPRLIALTAGVLGVHLALIVGEWPGFPRAAQPAAATFPPGSTVQAGNDTPDLPRDSPSSEPARVSTVRWIVPSAPPARAAVQVSPERTTPPPRSPAPATVQALNLPQPRPEPAAPAVMGPPVIAETAAIEPDAEAPPSSAEPNVSEPAPPAVKSNDEEATAAAPDHEVLAAAADGKRTQGAAANALPPAQPPASTQLEYAVSGRIKGIDYNAEGRLDWTVADGRYNARMEMRVFLLGSRVQTSTGMVGLAGLSPERFADKSRSEKAAHFDAGQNRVRFSNNAPDAALQPGAQDRLSLFLQISGLLQARPQAYVSGQTLEMQVVGTGDADIWRFEVGDEVTLSLPAGELRARPLKRLPRKEFDSTVEMWLAPALQHLPVRLRVTQANGDVADQQLSQMP